MSAAIGAAGMLKHSGRLYSDHENDERERNAHTAHHVEAKAQRYGKVCPHCSQRIGLDVFEFHTLMVHPEA